MNKIMCVNHSRRIATVIFCGYSFCKECRINKEEMNRKYLATLEERKNKRQEDYERDMKDLEKRTKRKRCW